MDLHLHIERLSIAGHDFDQRAAGRIAAALQGELAALLQSNPALVGVLANTTLDRLQAPALRPIRVESPEAFGQRVARSIHGTLHTAVAPAPKQGVKA